MVRPPPISHACSEQQGRLDEAEAAYRSGIELSDGCAAFYLETRLRAARAVERGAKRRIGAGIEQGDVYAARELWADVSSEQRPARSESRERRFAARIRPRGDC